MNGSPTRGNLTETARIALACLDLTSLNDGDDAAAITTLCTKAQGPAGPPAAQAPGLSPISPGARSLFGRWAQHRAADHRADAVGGETAPDRLQVGTLPVGVVAEVDRRRRRGLDPAGAHGDQFVMQVEGRVAMAGHQQQLAAAMWRWVKPSSTAFAPRSTRTCSPRARSRRCWMECDRSIATTCNPCNKR